MDLKHSLTTLVEPEVAKNVTHFIFPHLGIEITSLGNVRIKGITNRFEIIGSVLVGRVIGSQE